jgi:chromosome segregation ATPase
MSDDGEISVRELYEALEERERHIDELEAVLIAQEEENENCRNELVDKSKELQDSQRLLNQLRLDNDRLQQERTQLEDQVKTHKTQLDEQRNALAVASKSSEDAKKIQRDGNQQLYKLELENQR